MIISDLQRRIDALQPSVPYKIKLKLARDRTPLVELLDEDGFVIARQVAEDYLDRQEAVQ
ncbi:hypothetical protein [Alloyangia pacifica]|uniref:Uncharacterized protein n=1 Tax=Alloyangia pacifica TaxID=311180 RepID=A0A1I6PNF6_9RHOB|nr:hypothetical protein [Alloyangia pacifica]SDG32173.1 hypothetical protein SAMN04488245_102363 [Alloyangia pacifica]SFS41757.1 hypothetical protein SAMN04488050_101664 [Alloyangia pacifica]